MELLVRVSEYLLDLRFESRVVREDVPSEFLAVIVIGVSKEILYSRLEPSERLPLEP